MSNVLEYYLGNLGLSESQEQAKHLRMIVLSDMLESELIAEFEKYIFHQTCLYPETVKIINRALMADYGCEYLGLYGDNFNLKSNVYKRLIDKFPAEFSFKFYYADCLAMDNKTIEEIYPILKDGMLADIENIYYPTADLFDLIHESPFSFEFDMLLLDKYYQPCDKKEFDEYIDEFKEQYKEKSQQDYLNNLKWKKENTNA